MATKYYDTNAAGAGTGADWTNAYTTLAAAIAGIAAGDTLLVEYRSAESVAASTTWTFPGTITVPNIVMSVDKDASDAFRQGAYIKSDSGFNLTFQGSVLWDGVNFAPGTLKTNTGGSLISFATTGTNRQHIRRSNIILTNNNGSKISYGTSAVNHVTFEAITIDNGNANGRFAGNEQTLLIVTDSTPWGTGAAPAIGLIDNSVMFGYYRFDGCDVSIFGAGKYLLKAAANANNRLELTSCKINSGVTIADVAYACGSQIDMINCTDEAGVLYNVRQNERGKAEQFGTVYRTNGSSDGLNPYSRKITTSTFPTRQNPFVDWDIDFMVPAGNVGVITTVTVHLVTDNVALTNGDIWVEGSILSTATVRKATLADTSPGNALAATTALADDSATGWTTTGLTTPNKQKMVLTFTPQHRGMHRVRLKVAKPSTTIYVCELLDVA